MGLPRLYGGEKNQPTCTQLRQGVKNPEICTRGVRVEKKNHKEGPPGEKIEGKGGKKKRQERRWQSAIKGYPQHEIGLFRVRVGNIPYL